jgi:hypothetical protein
LGSEKRKSRSLNPVRGKIIRIIVSVVLFVLETKTFESTIEKMQSSIIWNPVSLSGLIEFLIKVKSEEEILKEEER